MNRVCGSGRRLAQWLGTEVSSGPSLMRQGDLDTGKGARGQGVTGNQRQGWQPGAGEGEGPGRDPPASRTLSGPRRWATTRDRTKPPADVVTPAFQKEVGPQQGECAGWPLGTRGSGEQPPEKAMPHPGAGVRGAARRPLGSPPSTHTVRVRLKHVRGQGARNRLDQDHRVYKGLLAPSAPSSLC